MASGVASGVASDLASGVASDLASVLASGVASGYLSVASGVASGDEPQARIREANGGSGKRTKIVKVAAMEQRKLRSWIDIVRMCGRKKLRSWTPQQGQKDGQSCVPGRLNKGGNCVPGRLRSGSSNAPGTGPRSRKLRRGRSESHEPAS